MKYAITYKQDGIETPKFCYDECLAAHKWMRHNGVDSLDMEIRGEDGKIYAAGFDGDYFLNEITM